MNGLERFGCQTIIYTPRNTFFLNSPNFVKDDYHFWNLGWFDFKNILFYQTNILLENRLERVQFLSLWIDFLQTLITNQIYRNLFEYFGFVFFFYSNEHEPIHVHVTHKGCQSIFELIMDNGVLVEIRVREKAGEEPLSSKDQKTAEEFIRKYSKNIITKWIKFFVLRQAVKSTTIKTKL